MHLKQLKLAGFKSFVDPTVVPFPSQLVAVLGPNGCGKSNIIDAVRWVMGESSAKNLRGESMTDVIFNGSSHRKPVGQASVELVFDNSLGRITGPFARYEELSVKRVVTRDGDSNYYLNGTRCRKRDVTDIFLGTGAGARGYSIIGQGTISRLIEAKPEELRAHLEEAAGVSKYKERRRETLLRIEQTQENLNRVADIRNELDKQLQRLERQAKAAERYTILKEEEALYRAEIMALRWQDFTAQQHAKHKELYELELSCEQHNSALTHLHSQKTLLNEQSFVVNEHVHTAQQQVYQLATEMARLEETILQKQHEKKRMEEDKHQIQTDSNKAQEQIKQDEEQLAYVQQQTQILAEKIQEFRKSFVASQALLVEAQEKKQRSNSQWQEAQMLHAKVKSDLKLAEVELQHGELTQQQLILRLEKIHQERSGIDLAALAQKLALYRLKQDELHQLRVHAEEQLKTNTELSLQLRAQVHDLENKLQQVQKEFNQQNSDYVALCALQKAASQSTLCNQEQSIWSDKPRLIEAIQVEESWQLACERVLGDDLQGFIIDDCSALWPHWGDYSSSGINVLTLINESHRAATKPRLIDKIKSAAPHSVHRLEHIYAAEDLDELLLWLPNLAPYESVITKEGIWAGQGFIKSLSRNHQDEPGLLARQEQIAELALVVDKQKQQIIHLQEARDECYQRLEKVLQGNQVLQQQFSDADESWRAQALAVDKAQHELQRSEQVLSTQAVQEEEIQQNLEEIACALNKHNEQIGGLERLAKQYELDYVQCEEEAKRYKDSLQEMHERVEHLRQALHQAELEHDRELSKAQQITERIGREQERLTVLQGRLDNYLVLCAQAAAPEQEMQARLAQQIIKHGEAEHQLSQYRAQQVQIKTECDDLDKKALQQDGVLKATHELLSQLRLQEQELSVRASSIQESLQELHLNAQSLLERIPQGVNQNTREEELLSINEKIKRLGAINLAAIDEYQSEQQRKLYLDEQYTDLTEALSTLQLAIDKMDKETKSRLEDTFNEVNNSFKALFPRLFGGGKAQLELTCDNLLEAGIVVMAQPPGKRNSTIHLLSGGEKAMTAVALVFAIFQLNPSPFCMLDEVDAPLDDVNVGRFCSLVKEMSQFVQFLFITHNKVTMELAEQLIGVTMREPGVSRIVAVDVHEALT